MKTFLCNICGQTVFVNDVSFQRELPSCSSCASTVRIREIAHHLLFFAKEIKGAKVVGLSDHVAIQQFIELLELSYVNTFFDVDPRLDISNPSKNWHNFADILISSDVMEHVMPPISKAFDGHYQVLRPGGKLILTTPYFHGRSFIEKYPHMRGYYVDENLNVIAQGEKYNSLKIADPVFHGGPGNTLEMRIFAPEIIREGLENAGFVDIVFNEEDVPMYGIIRSATNMGTITAKKPLND
jgi:SAM-dependent methyltransferase